MRRVAALVALLLVACAPPAAVAPQALGVVPPDHRFEIFTRGTKLTADSVMVVRDTLYGRAIAVHPAAPREPVLLPLVEVDSLRRAHTDRNALTATLMPALAVVAFGMAMSLAWGSD